MDMLEHIIFLNTHLHIIGRLFTAIVVVILPISIWNVQNELTILNVLEYKSIFR